MVALMQVRRNAATPGTNRPGSVSGFYQHPPDVNPGQAMGRFNQVQTISNAICYPAGMNSASELSRLRPNYFNSIFSGLLALTALAAGMVIAGHHPLAPMLAMAGCGFAAALCLLLPNAWLVLLPALLPVVDLAPWTGWLSFEEFDILVLGAAAGAWLRRAWLPRPEHGSRTSLTLLGLTGLFLLALSVAFYRGVQDAGGFQFGWFEGYDSSMNSLRLAKSFLLATLFAPLMGDTLSRQNLRSSALLSWGMALGLATASLAAIWERLAFPGLLNFSADYRTTALFWEMHVGGAALDGFLALTLPFAVLLVLRTQGMVRILLAALILAMGTYASLTTFSRGLYLAEVVSLAVLALILVIQDSSARKNAAGEPRSPLVRIIIGVLWSITALVLSYLVFRNGGYRTLIAVLGSLTVLVLTGSIARTASAKAWPMAIGTGLLLIAAILSAGWLVPKGSYGAFGLVFVGALAGIVASWRSAGHSDSTNGLILAAALSLPVAAAQVANHWGGIAALTDSIVALMFIVALAGWNIRACQPLWPTEPRRQIALLVAVLSLAAVTAVFSGGAYMGKRFSTNTQDLAGRMDHWRAGLNLMESPNDWLLGKGLGRFPPSFFFGAPGNEFPGNYRLNQEQNNAFLSLSGPHYQIGFGQTLHISQRIHHGPPGRYQVELDGRAARNATLVLGICTKHLLYPEACAGKTIKLSPTESDWQHKTFELDGKNLAGGPWYAPQLAVFSVTLETMGGRIDLDNLKVTDPLGRSILVNGDFSADMGRWFFTSDHHHLPWHMKNMFLHVLFEQGVAGLMAFGLLVLVALMRSSIGRRSYHPLAPAIIAGIAGFLIVGLFDSLLDVPRVAFLFFLMLMVGIQGAKKNSLT